MKRFVALTIAAACSCIEISGQLVCTNAQSADTTTYTNGAINDSLYFICQGQTAHLVVTPEGGEPGWDFEWYYFSAASNSWVYSNTDSGVSESVRNMPNGGFKVKVFDANGTMVGAYNCWVCVINMGASLNASTIPAGCGTVQLSGIYFPPLITPYYNPPPPSSTEPVMIGSNSEISVCFTATHSFVSDLAFYLIGPPQCGSPAVLLSQSPLGLGQDPLCNNGTNIEDLCFNTSATANLDICAAVMSPLTGTFGSYGPDMVPIDWDLLNGCNANSPGWSVQVLDCVDGDTGVLTDATLVVESADTEGQVVTLTHSTPAFYSGPILDNTCDVLNAPLFTMVPQPILASQIPIVFGILWSADPPFNIPGASSTLNITLNPAPAVDTYFTLQLTGPNINDACFSYTLDTEFFDYIVPEDAVVGAEDNILCLTDEPMELTTTIEDGVWYGPGIADPSTGSFDPSLAGPGIWDVNFLPGSSCITGDVIQFIVIEAPNVQIDNVAPMCSTEDAVNITANTPGGTWSGEGITNSFFGTFDPELVLDGNAQIFYDVGGECPASDVSDIVVETFIPLQIGEIAGVYCLNAPNENFTVNVGGGFWTGSGITDSEVGTFDPSAAGVGQWTVNYAYDDVCQDSQSIEVIVEDPAVDVDQVDPMCVTDGPITLSSSVSDGTWSGTGVTNQLTGVFNPLAIGMAGFYTVYFQLNNVCASVDSVIVDVQDIPIITLDLPGGLCADASEVLLGADLIGGIWTGDGITNESSGVFDPLTLAPGTATIQYAVDGVCYAEATGYIEIYPLPVVNAGEDTSICYDGSAFLAASGAIDYNWQPITGLSTPDVSNPVAAPDGQITYTVIGVDENGCTDTDQIAISVFEEPDVTINGPFDVCEDEQVQLLAEGLEEYSWSGEGLSAYEVYNPVADPDSTETYVLTGFDQNGCFGSDSVTVTVLMPDAMIVPQPSTGVSPLQVVFENYSTGDEFYWDFGNGESGTTSSSADFPESVFTGEQTYYVTVTAVLGHCPDSYTVEINSYYDAQLLLVPNVVTADGNGKNDTFRLLTQNLASLDIQIFDRWGKLVGSIQQPTGQWDPGDFGSGTYYYVLHANGLDGKTFDESGTFTVVAKE